MEVISVFIKFNSNYINLISLILSIIIVLSIIFGLKIIKNNINNYFYQGEKQGNVRAREVEIIKNTNTLDNNNKEFVKNIIENVKNIKFNSFKSEKQMEDLEPKIDKKNNDNNYKWYLEIPKINLIAPIEDGIDNETLNRSIGHFEETPKQDGNCGFAAHNRGYSVNYFSKLKDLEKGDIIYYFVNGEKIKYLVSDILIIYETDWSMLDNTEDNRITLITCVENRSEYRLCVQAKKINKIGGN